MSAGTQLSHPRISQFDFVEQDPWPERRRSATRLTVLSVVGVLLGIGTLVFSRRMFGALVDELPRDAMFLTAVVALVVVACARGAWRKLYPWPALEDDETSRSDLFVGWGTSVALILLAVGCCFPGDRTSDWLIWLPILIADQMWRQSFFDLGQPGRDQDILGEPLEFKPEFDASFATAEVAEPESASGDQIVQQLYRVRDDQGQELIYGTLRADFHPGQRTAVLHVGFCPPLSYLPEIEADALPGDSARLKVVQALAHGARLDVRLSETPTEDCHLWIDMAATPNEV